MELEKARDLIAQVQIAHRLAVAYYGILLSSVDEVAAELGMNFWYWEPVETVMPRKGSRPPSASWAWDYVPLYASTHGYKKSSGPTVPGDMCVTFDVYLEDSFEKERRKSAKVKGQPDPVLLPKGEARVEVAIYLALVADSRDFDVVWDGVEYPEHARLHPVGNGMQGALVDLDLVQLLTDRTAVAAKIRQIIDAGASRP